MKQRKKGRSWDSLESALRELVREYDNNYRISMDTGVEKMSLSRFARGERSLQLPFADKLARFFRLKITEEQ